MSECPKCGKKLEELYNVCRVYQRYPMSIDDNGDAYYDVNRRKEWGSEANTWDCPYCGKELFYREDKAVKFLRGESDE